MGVPTQKQQIRDANGHLVQQVYDPLTDTYYPGTSLATVLSYEDLLREWGRTVNGATMRIPVRPTPMATDGVYQGISVLLGTAGVPGDYLRKLQIEVRGTGGASVWLSQPGDPAATSGTTGSAITNTAAQTFTAATAITATKNQYAGRIVSFTYIPTGGTATVFKSRIASHALITASTTVALTLEDTPPAGAVPTKWAIEGTMSRRIVEAGRAAGIYEYIFDETAIYNGFEVTIGNTVTEVHALGDFT